ncbi:14341_t:CDS:2 [Entrophospora sp. SA101]|nr:14341_t:CDS:2 [Entrophospora sp. SA101]CAJ0831622.1 7097_t:CDS:2 [Entrophospora sp. SA101]
MELSQNTKINLSYLGSLLIAAASGTQYLFGTFSTELQEKLKFNSVQINTIGSAANYGFFLSSPFFGHIADNYGSKRICLMAAILSFTSYLCVALTYNGTLPLPTFLLCAIYLFFAGMASSAGILSALTTITRNVSILSTFRGIALSTPLGLFGLSAFMFSQFNNLFFRTNTYHFLLFVAITVGLCQFIGKDSCVENSTNNSTAKTKINNNSSKSNIVIVDENDNNFINERTPLLPDAVHEHNEISSWGLFQNFDAQLLFLTLFFIGGSGLMYINNVGIIVKTLYFSSIDTDISNPYHEREIQRLQNLHVSIISVCSCLGRLSAGFFSDITKYAYNIRRLWFIIISGILLLSGQFIAGFLFNDLNIIKISSVFVGLGFGFMFGIAPTIISEWFGHARFGSNWGFMSYAPAFGGQLLNLIFGLNLDYHADKKDCKGASCYSTAFYFSSAGCS